MKNSLMFIGIVLVAIMVIVSACSSSTINSTSAPASTSSQEGATLVQERCSVCHPLSRVESMRLTATEWSALVDQMVARGANLTSEEKTTVVNYLAANYGK
ncbi:MAG: hypothetical protein C3F13_01050 [Anaerolineales bacterium]|nr:hypothetical protein [Anaerolineae bacterium]PWB56688.1 MAG: hypothetical protein C3F13_01050 [Anaerolineales bacterium]